MTDQPNLEKIKDRIAKLLRMAEDSSSPNEAAIAASRARKLMDQYQLDLLDINSEFDEAFSTEGVGRFYAALPVYMNLFGVHVAKYNDCQMALERGEVTHRRSAKESRYGGDTSRINKGGYRPCFKGYKSDVELAIQMYTSLLAAVDRLRTEYLKDKGYDKYPVGVGRAFNTEAIREIGRRLGEMTVERELLMTDKTAGTCLMVIKAASVEAEFGPAGYKNFNVKMIEDDATTHARRAGLKAGAAIEITRQID